MPVLAASVGGTLAGGLHALTGPDHVACVLPICVGRRWWSAIYTGAFWGLGHGIGAIMVGALGYAVKGYFNLDAVTQWAEVFVGLSIFVIGCMGLREARQWGRQDHSGTAAAAAAGGGAAKGGASAGPGAGEGLAAASPVPTVSAPSRTSSLLTGILHGCSGSGHLLGVLPALAMPSLRCATAYLTMFGVGTMAAMSLFTAAVGELSVRMGESLDRPDIPAKLTVISSAFAVAIGIVWTARALVSTPWQSALATVGASLGRRFSFAF